MKLNPIPTSQGRNQPLYERHVTKSGRNRVKAVYLEALLYLPSIAVLKYKVVNDFGSVTKVLEFQNNFTERG